jgi:hypothetical protein
MLCRFLLSTCLTLGASGAFAQVIAGRAAERRALTEIRHLARPNVLVFRTKETLRIGGLVGAFPPTSSAWVCKGGANLAFVTCTRKIIDGSGCAIVVPHHDGYCSKPCD